MKLQNSFMVYALNVGTHLTIYHISLVIVGSMSAAAECFNASPAALSTVERVQLCKGAKSQDPAKCVTSILQLVPKGNGADMSVVNGLYVTPPLTY